MYVHLPNIDYTHTFADHPSSFSQPRGLTKFVVTSRYKSSGFQHVEGVSLVSGHVMHFYQTPKYAESENTQVIQVENHWLRIS